MTLRARIVLLFVTLAAGPLLAAGVFQFAAYERQWERLVVGHLTQVHHASARDITASYLALARELESDATSLLSDVDAEADVAAGRMMAGGRYARIEVRRPDGRRRRWDAPLPEPLPETAVCGGEPAGLVAVDVWSDRDPVNGSLTGYVPAGRVLRGHLRSAAVGRSGRLVVAERRTGRVLFVGCGPALPEGVGPVTPAEALLGAGGEGPSGAIGFQENGVRRTGVFTKLTQPPWLVVTSTAGTDFPLPGIAARMGPLVLALVLAVTATIVFSLMMGHMMRSLQQVADAAERVGQGDFTPWLPPPGSDEIGKLSHAIGRMALRVRAGMHQQEESRQLMFVGEMVGRLAHEIRNPMSSIKLNLQILEREVRRGRTPDDLADVLHVCLLEISRLDTAVHSVLRLGRPQRLMRSECNVHRLLGDSITLMAPHLREQGVTIVAALDAGRADILADEEQLRGVFLNLFVNAADAMGDGGTLSVRTSIADGADGPVIRVRVADDGRGVAPEIRRRIFQPFYTTKPEGSGIGLPLALQIVQSHGGRLFLEKRSELDRGAEFVVELPLAEADADLATTDPAETRPESLS